MHLKGQLEALKSHDARSLRIAELEAEIKATPYRASTLHPKFNHLLFQKFNWLAVKMPAVVTHRAAISTEVLDVIARAGRTSQSAHDLEAMLRENRAIRNAKLRLTFYGLQKLHAFVPVDRTDQTNRSPPATEGQPRDSRCARRLTERRGEPAEEIEHFDVGISAVSDNYIADALLAYVDSHENYILQWHEQHVQADFLQADHHGKRFSRMTVNGDNILNWRCVWRRAARTAWPLP